jgi:hypothetical protein
VLGGFALVSLFLLLGIQLTAAAGEGFPLAHASPSPRAPLLWSAQQICDSNFANVCYCKQMTAACNGSR